jgi:hypothetical protein
VETIQLTVDELVLKKFGEEKLQEYLNKIISMKKLEFFTNEISQSITMPEDQYQRELEKIRKDSWNEYKEGLPI